MDCTEQGAPPPMATPPTLICLVVFFMVGYSSEISRGNQEWFGTTANLSAKAKSPAYAGLFVQIRNFQPYRT
jgi:hypothetical protein